MNSRQLVRLFFSTLLIGGVSAGIVGFLVRWEQFDPLFEAGNVMEILSTFVWLMGVGLIFSVISQMSFFAYLTIHRFGISIFKNMWSGVQIVLIVFVLFDLIYLRYNAFNEGEGLMPYIGLAGLVLAVGLLVAYVKMKQTNSQAFIPALFFMTVFTVLQWVPVLVENDQGWLYFMLWPLLICNSYQLLTLHKINERIAREIEKKQVTAR
ncbi:KinB-signaling pathway activation protein [Bacillus sp. AGMB 02131]|uniref:KinB-signaling pathway activation protein n=1 Tax=Peribacillus faecalis TaxID=2772559 RepID=A0A927CZ46_9BACI|nr:KinB-signaling pathway activation protein [Peribacillus faecalis]MBD3108595.1 KinB-signaling pathway activation protein [Peribacillus faecalis]